MDQRLNKIIENVKEIKDKNTLFADNLSSDSKQLISFDIDFNKGLNHSKISQNVMKSKSTPTLVMPKILTNKTNLFTFNYNNNKQTKYGEKSEMKINSNINQFNNDINEGKNKNCEKYSDNSLGLSPVKESLIDKKLSFNSVDNSLDLKMNESNEEFVNGLDGFQMNSFSLKNDLMGNTFKLESDLMDESFKSLSKCSDFDLKQEQNIGCDQTFRPPNIEFENKSIDTYFQHKSKPINGFDLFGTSDHTKSDTSLKSSNNDISFNCDNNEMSFINESFISVNDEISASDNTLDIAQKIIDRNNRKRKAEKNLTFNPITNSTQNLFGDNSSEDNLKSSKTVMTSGLGTVSTFGTKTQLIINSKSSSSIESSFGNALNLNQMLSISPMDMSLTIGCFVSFKLNYLKVRNHSMTTFKAIFKLSANVETMNSIEIKLPSEPVSIPAFFDGLLTNEILITPLMCGSFTFVIQIYPLIENINLPISPLSVTCNIESDEVLIKRLSSTNSSVINYDLFENTDFCGQNQTIDFIISNHYFSNEIPLKFSLEPSKCLMFEPLYRHPESSIHHFRCPDVYSLHLVTKTQYEMKIPLKICSFGEQSVVSSLTIAIDSVSKSHAIAIYQLSITFWPKKFLKEPSLQCSDSSIQLKADKWVKTNFRNKSTDNAILVRLECTRDKEIVQNVIKFTSNDFIIAPKKKLSIGLITDKMRVKKNSNYHILAKYSSGLGNSLTVYIPVVIN